MDTTNSSENPQRRVEDRKPSETIDWEAPGAPAVPQSIAHPIGQLSPTRIESPIGAAPAATSGDAPASRYVLAEHEIGGIIGYWNQTSKSRYELCRAVETAVIARIGRATKEVPADLQQLKALALAATPGEWMRLFGERTVYDRMEDGCRGNIIVRADYPFNQQDAANLDYIAAANPAVVLGLIAQVESLYNAMRLWKQKAEGAARIESAAAPALVKKKAYGPDNPPRLRKDGESVRDYRIAMGWDAPPAAAPATASGDELAKWHEPSWQKGYSAGYNDAVGDVRAPSTSTSPAERAASSAGGPGDGAPKFPEPGYSNSLADRVFNLPCNWKGDQALHSAILMGHTMACEQAYNLVMADEQARAAVSAATKLTTCALPPTGWTCTRASGHEGPCAAVPTEVCADDYTPEQFAIYQHGVEGGKLIARGMERYNAGVAARHAATKPTADLSKLTRYGTGAIGMGGEFGPDLRGDFVRFADVQSLLATKPAAAPVVPEGWKRASAEHAAIGWTWDCDFIDEIRKQAEQRGWRIGCEEVDTVLSILVASTTGAAQTAEEGGAK